MLCDDLEGCDWGGVCRREAQDGGDIGVLMADSLYGGNQYRIVKQLSSK